MKRPLLFGCICLSAFIAIWTCYFNAPPFYRDIPVKEEEHVVITGQLYQKEYRSYYGTDRTNLYLKSIQIIDSDTGRVSKVNPKYKVICEMNRTEHEPELGRTLRIAGTWKLYEHAANPGEFDLADYYATQYIVGKMEDCTLEGQGKGFWPLREKLWSLRNMLEERLYQALPDKEASILAKMLLGVSSGLDEKIKELYQRNGIVHILSISGLHITMIGMSVYRLLRRCSCPIVPAAVVGAVFLLLYGCMTGFGISSCRAIGMYLIHMLGEITGRSYDLLTATGILMAVMLINNPRLIFHCGFLLSFASVTAIGCLYPILPLQEVAIGKRHVMLLLQDALQKKSVGPLPFLVRLLIRQFDTVLQGLWASASISIFTLPIMLYYFYEIPVYSPFVNLLVLPFMGLVMAAGIVLIMFPEISFLAEFEHIILSGYERICLLFEELPYHTWLTGRPQFWQIVLFYAGILLIIWLCNRKTKWWSLGIAALVLLLGADFENDTEIAFLDVGQGDCIVVMTENGKTYLFDGGSSTERTVGEDIIQPFLKYHGIDLIDGVFISHPDEDHISGIMELLKQKLVEIDTLYLPDVAEECKDNFQGILECVTEQQVVYYSAGDYLQTGDMRLTCLHPARDFFAETNVYSGCFLLEIGDAAYAGQQSREAEDVAAEKMFRLLLTGDVEGEGEYMLTEQLRKLGIDQVHVLKVAHHGSRYSTSKDFLEQVDPALAVISCGQHNSYGHPHEELLARLQEEGTIIMTTSERGAITVKIGRNPVVRCWYP